MTPMEFQTVIAPVLSKWPRSYNGDQVHLFHVEFQNYAAENFKRVIDHLLKNSRVAPMESDFKKAIQELAISPKVSPTSYRPEAYSARENFLYCVRDNIWADDNYVFVRDSRPGFIIKKDSPDHPFVVEDAQVRDSRIKEVKSKLGMRA